MSEQNDVFYQGYTKIYETVKDSKFNPKTKFAITEKVHGSCFCFVYDVLTKQIHYAKRSKILKSDDSFFGYQTILQETEPKILTIVEYLMKCTKLFVKKTPLYVCVYGELFGGSYPGFVSKINSVQSGIYYSPCLNFYAFDTS